MSYLRRLVLFGLVALILTIGGMGTGAWFVAPHTRPGVAHAQGVPVDPQLGYYTPNTYIEERDGTLWFVRRPYESPLAARGDGTFLFLQGWLEGRLLLFSPNDAGGTSMLLLGDDNTWSEFARSGEIYDLDPALIAALGDMLERRVNELGLHGAALSVHMPDGREWVGARGLSNEVAGIPAVPNDRFRVASVTKMFVAVVILQLLEEGRLTLDDTLDQWMPRLVPNGDQMTIRHLLNHTSGVYNYLDDGFMSGVLRDPQRSWEPVELVTYGVLRRPYFTPGEPGRWHYSNTNYVLLGMVVEHATGAPLEDEIRRRILEPLGMRNTYFPPDEHIPGGVMRGYLGQRDITDMNMSFAWGVGNIVSDAADLNRFGRGLFGGELLGPEALSLMHRFVPVHGAWGASQLTYGLGLMQDVLGVAPTDSYGNPRSPGAGLVRGHTGALTGYRTALWYLPESGITLAVGINQMYVDPNILITDAMNILLAYQEQHAE